MYLENVMNELQKSGIDAAEITVIKNGVECTGLQIFGSDGNEKVSKIVYYAEDETMESFLQRIRVAVDEETPLFDLETLLEREYLEKHVHLAIQKPGNQDLVKHPHLGTELYLVIHVAEKESGTGMIRIGRNLMPTLDVTEEELWETAIRNDRESFVVTSLAELIGMGDDDGLYVVTNKRTTYGAAALMFPDVFRDFCDSSRERSCYILPSSTQELILLPESRGSHMPVSDLADMVYTINNAEVDPLIQLNAIVYRYDREANEITIACEQKGNR